MALLASPRSIGPRRTTTHYFFFFFDNTTIARKEKKKKKEKKKFELRRAAFLCRDEVKQCIVKQKKKKKFKDARGARVPFCGFAGCPVDCGAPRRHWTQHYAGPLFLWQGARAEPSRAMLSGCARRARQMRAIVPASAVLIAVASVDMVRHSHGVRRAVHAPVTAATKT